MLANIRNVMYGRRAFDKGEMTEKTLNLRGLKCPLPTLRVRKALAGLKPGDLLVAECTDPLTEIDIPNLINQTGDELLATSRADQVISFRIRKR
jgi:tRNA 2-thiouridine synthesizing protein A